MKIENNKISPWLLLPVIILTSCVKDISIPQAEYTPRATIQCSLESGTVPILYFYRTIPYFAQTGTSLHDLFIKNALVKISSQDSTDILQIDSTYNYIKCEFEYFYKGSVITRENRQYNLKISYNNITYTASTTTNLPTVSIDSVGYTTQFKDIYGEHEGVIPYFHDIPNQSNYYRYEMTRIVDTTMKYREGKLHSPCIGSGSVTILEVGRSVYNDQSSSGEQMNLVIEPAYSHRKGLTGLIRIETIDKVTYDFLYQLDRQKLEQMNPFVEPVFLTNGQFGRNALGYFGSITRSIPVLFVFPE
jgi:hypothetical protein